MKRLLCLFALVFTLVFSLSSCGKSDDTIVIGTMAQPGEPILKHIQAEFKEKTGKNLEIKLFTDFATPNNSLAAGELDANLFQHAPFLNTYNEKNGTDLQVLSIMYDCVYGGYSKKVETLDQIPNGAKITIANDASNMLRCLKIIEAEGLIKLAEGLDASTVNPDNVNEYITENTKGLVITPMSTNLIAGSLDDKDVYLGVVNATFAINAKLNETSKLVCKEADPQHVNANIVAVNKKDIEADWAKALKEILESEETDEFVRQTFGATIVPYHG